MVRDLKGMKIDGSLGSEGISLLFFPVGSDLGEGRNDFEGKFHIPKCIPY